MFSKLDLFWLSLCVAYTPQGIMEFKFSVKSRQHGEIIQFAWCGCFGGSVSKKMAVFCLFDFDEKQSFSAGSDTLLAHSTQESNYPPFSNYYEYLPARIICQYL